MISYPLWKMRRVLRLNTGGLRSGSAPSSSTGVDSATAGPGNFVKAGLGAVGFMLRARERTWVARSDPALTSRSTRFAADGLMSKCLASWDADGHGFSIRYCTRFNLMKRHFLTASWVGIGAPRCVFACDGERAPTWANVDQRGPRWAKVGQGGPSISVIGILNFDRKRP